MLSSYVLVDVLAAGLAIWLLQKAFDRNRSRSYPPGPKGLPIIGNLLDVPQSQEWITYSSWNDKWGDIVSIKVLGQRIVYLGSVKAARELLDNRSNKYSDRPKSVLADMIGYVKTIPMAGYGDKMRTIRRMFSKAIGTRALMDELMPLMSRTVQDYAVNLVSSPENFIKHIHLMTSTNILLVAYGYQIKSPDDGFLKTADKSLHDFSVATTPGTFLVEFFPILKYVPEWFPGAGWKKTIASFKANYEASAAEPFEFVKREMAAGTHMSSFTSRNLEVGSATPQYEELVRHASHTLYTAGYDTSASTLSSFFLAMTLYPEVQRRAQEELDRVIGTDRFPTFNDRDSLPYINALCLELHRWMPVGPVGLPHVLTEDDTYNGYFLPKGAIFFVNNWRLLHDPEMYHDPMQFKPERFLATDGKEPEYDSSKIAFGWGRRACPGMQVADATIFIAVATTLAVCEISPIVVDGKPVLPPPMQTSGIITHPVPFQCNIKSRSGKADTLLRSVVENR